MGLISSLRMGARSLQAHQTAIQTTGHNISNANTEGYTRQRVNLSAAHPHHLYPTILGAGVEIRGIERAIENFVEEQLQREDSKLGSVEQEEMILRRVSGVLNELSDADLSTALNEFFDALQEVAARPEDQALRRSFVENAKLLTNKVRFISQQMDDIRKDLNTQVEGTVNEINSLATQLADLNQQILRSENSGPSPRNANDLRDMRDRALRELSQLVEIRRFEQPDGTVNVSIDGEYLVIRNNTNLLTTESSQDRGITIETPKFASNMSDVVLRGGKLAGLVEARDGKIGSYIDTLNDFAGRFAHEFNRIHSTGTGTQGVSSVTGTREFTDNTAALSTLGLTYAPTNGQFDMQVRNKLTGEVTVTTIDVDLDGIGADTTLSSLSTAIDAVSNVSSSIDTNGRLQISVDNSNYELAFRRDTSGVLAVAGVHTFFRGDDARSIRVTDHVDNDLTQVAAAQSFDVGDNTNALALHDLRSSRVYSSETMNMDEYYQGFIGTVAVDAATAKDTLDNEQAIMTRLENERQMVSGVNIDEEMVDLIQFQRAFQASSRFISVIDELLDTLINRT